MKLGTRLLLPLLGVVTAVMLVYTAWALNYRERAITAEAHRETRNYAAALGIALENAFRDDDLSDVQDIIDRISSEPKIYGVQVYDTAGAILFASTPIQVAEGVDREALRRVLAGDSVVVDRAIDEEQVFVVLRPIFGPDGRIAAAFEVAQPLAFLEAEKASTRLRFFLNTLTLLLAVTILFLWLLRRNLARPLGRFVHAARTLGRGELAHRISVERFRGAELIELARELNRMADSLQTAQAEVIRQGEERLELERRMREADKLTAIGNLAAGLAHEIAAPLSVISGRAELLLMARNSAEDQRSLRIIIDQIDRISGLMRNMLDFARRSDPSLEPIDLAAVIRGTMELLAPELDKRNIHVDLRLDGAVGARADPHLLHQVFINLVLNAADALEARDDERRIEIEVESSDPDFVDVTIQDNGPGIPDPTLERIFDPFFTTKPSGKGTGLGLAVVRSIIGEHGGRIDAENREDTTGALFRIRLRAAPLPVAHE